jgi:hypothetical protein
MENTMEEVAVGRLAELADGDHKVFALDAFEVGVRYARARSFTRSRKPSRQT